jgi:hypothetical protein
MSTLQSEGLGLKGILRVSDEVREGIAANGPVVALESTIYTHGALGDDLALEDVVRRHGGIPAVVGILDGIPTVGLTPTEVARMVDSGTARKVSRRDVAYLAGLVSSFLISWICRVLFRTPSLDCSQSGNSMWQSACPAFSRTSFQNPPFPSPVWS